jgi:hypothetical protein
VPGARSLVSGLLVGSTLRLAPALGAALAAERRAGLAEDGP